MITIQYFGAYALIRLLCHSFFVIMAFWAMGALKTDYWIKKNHISQARLMYLFIAITIGYTVSSFFLEFIQSSQNLVHLF